MQAVLRGELGIVVSPGMVDEYLDVLNRSKFTRYGFPPAWVQQLLRCAEHLPADPKDLPDLPDPDDRLLLAVGQVAGILVTGNLKDFPVGQRGAAQVLSHADFWSFRGQAPEKNSL